jgi:hypothetical protein
MHSASCSGKLSTAHFVGGPPKRFSPSAVCRLQTFRDAVFEQLGSDQLVVPVTTDIAGKAESHAVRLDKEATESIRKARLHQKVATTIFFESNGGQSQSKAEATVPEIRAAVGGPEVNLAEIETTLEALTATCFYLVWDRNKYRFGLRPNLNQMLVVSRGTVRPKDVDDRLRQDITDLFKDGAKGVDRRIFPQRSNDVPDRAQLCLAILGLDALASEPETSRLIEEILRNAGTSGRTYKSGLLFAAADSSSPSSPRTTMGGPSRAATIRASASGRRIGSSATQPARAIAMSPLAACPLNVHSRPGRAAAVEASSPSAPRSIAAVESFERRHSYLPLRTPWRSLAPTIAR